MTWHRDSIIITTSASAFDSRDIELTEYGTFSFAAVHLRINLTRWYEIKQPSELVRLWNEFQLISLLISVFGSYKLLHWIPCFIKFKVIGSVVISCTNCNCFDCDTSSLLNSTNTYLFSYIKEIYFSSSILFPPTTFIIILLMIYNISSFVRIHLF